MLQDSSKEHVEVLHDGPGLCPDCLDRYITGRGGGKVQLERRDGRWVCPRSGPSLAQEFGRDVAVLGWGASAVGPPAVTFAAGGWGLAKLLERWRARKRRTS